MEEVTGKKNWSNFGKMAVGALGTALGVLAHMFPQFSGLINDSVILLFKAGALVGLSLPLDISLDPITIIITSLGVFNVGFIDKFRKNGMLKKGLTMALSVVKPRGQSGPDPKTWTEKVNERKNQILFLIALPGSVLMMGCVTTGISSTAVKKYANSMEGLNGKAAEGVIQARIIIQGIREDTDCLTAEQDAIVREWITDFELVDESFLNQLTTAHQDLKDAIAAEEGVAP